MEEYRNLLVAVAGLTPQVITEMLFYLTVRHQPPIPVSEIHVVTTQPGKEHILQSLLAPGTGKFYTFCTEYDLDPTSIAFDAAHVHVLTDAADVPLDDIRSKICITPGREVFRQPGFGLTLLKSSARSGVLCQAM